MSVKTSAKSGMVVVTLATLLCAAPVSLQRSDRKGSGSGLVVTLTTAAAADLGVEPRRARRHYAGGYGRLYDAVCGGPYVGGGWNGGTYWGGPWMDLSCYGQLPPHGPPPRYYSWWWW
jgi:hypothetical protein